MGNKARTRTTLAARLLPSELEYLLLEETQRGNKTASFCLAIHYNWFLRKLARAYAGTGSDREMRFHLWRELTRLFEECVTQIDLSDAGACFLEAVYVAAEREFGQQLRKKKAHAVRKLLETDRVTESFLSLNAPLGDSDDEGEFGDLCAQRTFRPPAEEVWRAQLRKHVSAALDALPRDLALALRLSFIDDRDEEAIADAMGISTAKVRSHVNNALRRLRHTLPAAQYDDHVA